MALVSEHRLREESGFTIIEVLVAAIVLLVGVLATLLMIDTAQSSVSANRAREQGTNLQRELVEAARTIPYDQLTPGTVGSMIRAQPGLGDASISAAGWTVRRRNVTYTVTMGTCAVDDPQDGAGAHEAGVFCANQGTTTSADDCNAVLGGSGSGVAYPGDCGVDTNNDGGVDGLTTTAATTCSGATCDGAPLDYKRVVSLVRWTQAGKPKWNLQVTTVNSPGVAAAPQISDLHMTAPTSGGTTVISATSASFSATASPAPVSMSWYIDGNRRGQATAGASDWTFTWDLGSVSTSSGAQPAASEVLDGDYLVSAKGFDQYGQYGQTRSLNVTVNRRVPFAPINLRAGRNGTAVDVEWTPNKENDLQGYNVYRKPASGSDVKVCSLVTTNQCRDATAPAAGLGTLRYYATAVETSAAGSREGDQSAQASVSDTNTPPNPPLTLTASTSSGNVILQWTRPPVGDVDPGDAIDHWVIYRDGVSYADRYDRTATDADLSWTDTKTNGQTHRYWVSAVDTQLGESILVGPVSP